MRMEVTEEERRAILQIREENKAFNAGVEAAARLVIDLDESGRPTSDELVKSIRDLKRIVPGMTNERN